jgi:hypothetical protein
MQTLNKYKELPLLYLHPKGIARQCPVYRPVTALDAQGWTTAVGHKEKSPDPGFLKKKV